jgi:hypothetical protein
MTLLADNADGAHVLMSNGQARRYVMRVAAQMLLNELLVFKGTEAGWLLGGVTDLPSRRRIQLAARRLAMELDRRGNR